MDAQTLRQEYPEVVAEIESAAREGMITNQAASEAQAAAVTAATAAERSRVLGLSAVVMGADATARLTTVVESGITAEQATALGVTAGTGDAASRAAILDAITNAAPAGLKPGQVEHKESAAIDTSSIYASRQPRQ